MIAETVISSRFKAALTLSAVLGVIALMYYAHHTRIESFDYVWYPDDTYGPAQRFPNVDVMGHPKVVLVRSVGNLQCYAVYYDRELANVVQQHPTRPIRITFRVKVKFGWPYWIEVVETASRPNIAWGQLGQHGRGECF